MFFEKRLGKSILNKMRKEMNLNKKFAEREDMKVKLLILRITKMFLALFMFLAVNNLVFAENAAAQDSFIHYEKDSRDSSGMGFYLCLPSYLYSRYSAFGVQGGYQFEKVHVRLDLSVVNDYENGRDIWFAIPSFGIFYTHDWKSIIRVYEGITVGGESGLKNSFNGQVGFITYIAGAELLSFDQITFFLEFGSGLAFNPKEDAFNTGTVIGGGIKYFFGKF
jgi:hypothetical protein